MWVYIDDSGDPGMKVGSGSSSHIVMAACVFREADQLELLSQRIHDCREATRHKPEFKSNKTKDSVKDSFFEHIAPVRFHIRAIAIEKEKLYSAKLRSDGSALKSYAIRQLLSKSFGQVRDAKVFIDGRDVRGFGVSDQDYLIRMVNRESPGTIQSVRFVDSKESEGVQLADMCAGAINRAIWTHKPRKPRHLDMIRPRTYQPEGTLWHFCR